MPDVSVVIPTHNRRDLLTVTLKSALLQRNVEVEVIVVDDGSSDDTARLISAESDRRVRLVRHASSLGVSAARNRGVAEASAAWIAFLDDDDIWAPGKLAGQLAAAQERGRAWVYGGAVEIDARGRLIGGEPPPRPEILLRRLRRSNLMPAGSSNVVVRSATLDRAGGFSPDLRHLADWDLWLRLARLGPPACVPAPLVAYRLHSGQATLDRSGMLAEARILEARHAADRSSIYRWLAWSSLRVGRRAQAFRAYLGAVRAGDPISVARAFAVLLYPRMATSRVSRRSRRWLAWQQEAEEWLRYVLSQNPAD